MDRGLVAGRTIWLAREADLPTVRLEYIPSQGYWLVDDIRSPVVQLVRGTPTVPGRLYFSTFYYRDDDSRQEFPPGFVKWASAFLTLVRRRFRRDPASGVYVGPTAPSLPAEPS